MLNVPSLPRFSVWIECTDVSISNCLWDMTTECFVIVAVRSGLCCQQLSVARYVLMFASETVLQAKPFCPFQSVREGQSLSAYLAWLCISLLQDQQVACYCSCENDEIRPWQSCKHNPICVYCFRSNGLAFGCTSKCNFQLWYCGLRPLKLVAGMAKLISVSLMRHKASDSPDVLHYVCRFVFPLNVTTEPGAPPSVQ